VQESLKNLTPQQLSRYLPPREARLDEIALPVKTKYKPYEYTPEIETLKEVAEPLGAREMQRLFARPYERDTEVADLVGRLAKERANILLVGEAGAGKSTVLAQAVRTIEREWEKAEKEKDADEDKKPRHRFWLTSGSRLIAGMKYLGQWEERAEEIVGEIEEIDGVLCAENLLDLAQTGGQPNESVASFFLPYLQRGELRLVAEATPAELDACRRLLPGLAEVFQIVTLPPFTREKALAVLDAVAAAQSRDLNLQIGEGVTALTQRLFQRFMPYQVFPGKTPAFLIELCEQASRAKRKAVAKNDVIVAFARRTGLPELFLRDEIPLANKDVVATLTAEVIGQPAAVQTAANLISVFKAGVNDPARPVGVLLFAGPTGVGKTELAKALARFFFGQGDQRGERLIRLDMSEYSGYGAAERLVRNPDGAPSELIQKLRQQPFAVVLLDEIEKADPAVFDVLLSVFDEGRLTDRYGRVTTFRSAIIVMTSNLGADKFTAIGYGDPAPASPEQAIQNFFRPEFYNRFDSVARFHPLTQDTLLAITRKELAALNKREGLLKTGCKLSFSDDLVRHLANIGYEPRYGARPLQRAIETQIVAPLARYLLANGEPKKEIAIGISKEKNLEIYRMQI
jgi:ATP-dependent Clp protease ATP-binding subunit ClpC